MSRSLALSCLSLAALLSAGQALGDQPPLPPAKLTAQEVAARLEKAGKDPALLLEVAAIAEPARARQLRQQVKQLLQALPAPGERAALAGRVAPALARAAATPDELQEILGAPRAVARQVLHRRALEQWHYDTPLPLLVTFERPRGQEARLRSALADADPKTLIPASATLLVLVEAIVRHTRVGPAAPTPPHPPRRRSLS